MENSEVTSGTLRPPVGQQHYVRTHQVMGPSDVERAVRRIAHEVIERNHGLDDVVVLGLANGGIWLAQALQGALQTVESGVAVPAGVLDVSFHRDDIGIRSVRPAVVSSIPVDLTGRVVVLVDDVLFTGRTVRAALDALVGFGRPRMIQLAVMVDRGHRELPLRADFVGKNLPTALDELVSATADGVVISKPSAMPKPSAMSKPSAISKPSAMSKPSAS